MPETNNRIQEIQTSYFSLINDCFKEQLAYSREAGGDAVKGITDWANGKPTEEITGFTKQRLIEINNFWKEYYKPLRNAIVDVGMLPTYSISRPLQFTRQLSSAGLYCDFFIFHDDSLAGLRNFEALNKMPLDRISLNLLRDFVEIMNLKPAFTCDTDVPIAIIIPGERDFNPEIESKLVQHGKFLTIGYVNDLLQTKYNNWEELQTKTDTIIGSAAIKRAIKNPLLIPAPFSDTSDPSIRLQQCFQRVRMIQSQSYITIPDKVSMFDLASIFLTEFVVMEGQLHGSLETDSAPLLPRYTWDLYKWRIDSGNIDSSRLLGWEERRLTGISTSLQKENLDWLCNVPLDALIELRKTGFLEEFRGKLRSARGKMTLEKSADFDRLSKEIQEDISSAVKEHQDSIKALENEARTRIKVDTATFMGKMWFNIASCVVPILTIVGIMSDGAEYLNKLKTNLNTLKDVPQKYKRGPWGVLMQVKKDRP